MKGAMAIAAVAAVLLAGCVTPAPSPGTVGAEPAPLSSGAGAAPSAQASQAVEIARGHIVAAGPYTGTRSIAVLVAPGVDGFFWTPPPMGTNVTTRTTDNRGAGYDLSINFHDASGTWISGCSTAAVDEVCKVPTGATRGEVTAAFALDVDVTVIAL